MTDPIADLLTRIRNASAARQEKVDRPGLATSRTRIAEVLKSRGLPPGLHVRRGRRRQGAITVLLKYERATASRSSAGSSACRSRACGATSATDEIPRVAERPGHRHPLDPEGRPGRPRGPQAEGGRRAPLRGLVGAGPCRESESFRSSSRRRSRSPWTAATVRVEGPKGKMHFPFNANASTVEVDEGEVQVARPDESTPGRARLHGLTRTLVDNTVDGRQHGLRARRSRSSASASRPR